MKIVLALVLLSAVFAVGRGTAPDPETHYKVLHVTDTKTVEVPTPAPFPDACNKVIVNVNEVLTPNQEIVNELSDLKALTHDISTYNGQDQIMVNKLAIRADTIQINVDRLTGEVQAIQVEMAKSINHCNDDLQNGAK